MTSDSITVPDGGCNLSVTSYNAAHYRDIKLIYNGINKCTLDASYARRWDFNSNDEHIKHCFCDKLWLQTPSSTTVDIVKFLFVL
jgi:hypothetical protein